MNSEWRDRIDRWVNVLKRDFYEPLGKIELEGFTTFDRLEPAEAEKGPFLPMPEGTQWGRRWEYCWMRGKIRLDQRAEGKRIVLDLNPGGEATIFLDGQVFGTRRAGGIREPHHYICDQWITLEGVPGSTYRLLLETYAGHGFPGETEGDCATGPVRGDACEFEPVPDEEFRTSMGRNSWGIWHEDAYQLWLDVETLRQLLAEVDDNSLRAARIEEALEEFTRLADFEQPREDRLSSYRKAREALRPALKAHNGSTAPVFSAVGNAHIDLSWLWPYRETERKIARTFAQQLRLMEIYPDYRYIQSQPEAYRICRELYPDLYERILKKVKDGQWIPDGAMWVEPDTNMIGGEAMIRQLLYGKQFFREEFGVDCRLLWLPDTFGYSGAIPQILKGCGVHYLTTQKIFWNYNGSDPFPYNYFTWQGIDGSEVIAFLHMDYTARTDPQSISRKWKARAQKRDLDRFLLPFGYGDGGGGPTRDDMEFIRREKDLEGIPRVEIEAPEHFFETMESAGKPVNRYVGELYFQCHRGTYTSQSAVKRGNRRCETALREAEIWSAAAGDRFAWPGERLKECWRLTLLNQFHDILPGSSIARVYQEAGERVCRVEAETAEIIRDACAALTEGEGRTWFNSLSWERKALVQTGNGLARVIVPPVGWTSAIMTGEPDKPASCMKHGTDYVLSNGELKVTVNRRGEIVSCRDSDGKERIGGSANVLHMYKDIPRKYDAWDVDSMYRDEPVPLEGSDCAVCVENDPWRAAVKIVRKFGDSVWEQRISLEAESRRIDFDTRVDWHERHRLLKAAFPTGIHAEEASNEIQFGYVRRPTHRSRPYDADRFEVCNHRYTALYDENAGAAVLNDCKYGVSMLGDEIALTLLRAPTCPDLHADQGEHRFRYSYCVWDGPWVSADTVRQAYELNVPLTEGKGQAGSFSLLRVDNLNIIAEAMKEAEDGSGDLILRLYESKHAAVRTLLHLNIPVAEAWECDMLEQPQSLLPLEKGVILLSFRGFEIKTIRIRKA